MGEPVSVRPNGMIRPTGNTSMSQRGPEILLAIAPFPRKALTLLAIVSGDAELKVSKIMFGGKDEPQALPP